ncbi:MAG TPA: thiamine diphosphokinase [Candidatus Binatia bacterium]|nr:thiamine diphosphokinase [Candidatus Binatia bacterium]
MPREAAPLHAIVLADGAAPARAVLDAAWPGWADGVALVVAADGGVRHAGDLELRVDRWVGDGDSTGPEELATLEAAGVAITRSAVDKDESDTELALDAALDAGADRISILGALGGARTDHALANISLLLDGRLANRSAVIYDEHGARLSVLVGPDHRGLPGRRELVGRAGDIVSLLPMGESVHRIETEGLRYPLLDEPLLIGRARGLSNVRLGPVARVSVGSGRLLLVETPARLGA